MLRSAIRLAAIFILLTGACISQENPLHVVLSDSLIKAGDYVVLHVNGLSKLADETKMINYYEDGRFVTVSRPRSDSLGFTIWQPSVPGYRRIYGRVACLDDTTRNTDTVGVYVAQVPQLQRVLLSNVTYFYVTKIFADTAVTLPQNTIVLAKSYSPTTKKILLNMLYPKF